MAFLDLFRRKSVGQVEKRYRIGSLGRRSSPVVSRERSAAIQSYEHSSIIRPVVAKIAFAVATNEWSAYRVRRSTPARKVARKLTGHAVTDIHKRNFVLRDMVASRDIERIEGHEMVDLLYRGDGMHLFGYQVLQIIQSHLDLAGEAFLEKVRANDIAEFANPNIREGQVNALIPIVPSWVKKIPGEQSGKFVVAEPGGKQVEKDPDDIVWIKDPSPLDPFGRGFGMASTLATEVDIDHNASLAALSRYVNGGVPAGLVTIAGADEAILKREEQKFASRYQGSARSGSIAFTDAEVKFQRIDDKLTDLATSEQSNLMFKRILAAYGVPPEIMAMIENSNRATIEAASYIFARWVLVPRLCFLEAVINERLMSDLYPKDAADVFITFESPVEENKERQREIMSSIPNVFQVKDVRSLAGFGSTGDNDIDERFIANSKTGLLSADQVKDHIPQPDGASASSNVTQGMNRPRERHSHSHRHTKALGDEPTDDSRIESVVNAVDPSRLFNKYEPLWRQQMKVWAKDVGNDVGGSIDEESIKDAINQYINDRGANNVEVINGFTRRRLRKDLIRGVQNEENLEQIADRIQKSWRINRSRAETIARTEVLQASNHVTNHVFNALGVEQKEWVTQRDSRVREQHSGIDKQRRPVQGVFSAPSGALARYPGDFATADLNVNCRCTIRAITPNTENLGPDDIDQIWRAFDARLQPWESKAESDFVIGFDQQIDDVLKELRKHNWD